MARALAGFLARGGVAHDRANPAEWDAAVNAVVLQIRQQALLLPIGADSAEEVLSHRDIMTVVDDSAARLGQRHGDERVAFLSMSGMMERVLGLYAALSSTRTGSVLFGKPRHVG